jgi:Metallo-beta-lactamase superfamily
MPARACAGDPSAEGTLRAVRCGTCNPPRHFAPASKTGEMKVELLNVGWISGSLAVWRQGEDPDRRIRFPVPAFLIETSEERILIDTGLNPAGVKDPGAFYGRPEAAAFELEQEEVLSEQVDLTTLTRVVLTHLHFDHAGGLALVPRWVPIVVQRREWEAGQDAASVKKNFFYPRDYALDEREVVLIDGDRDWMSTSPARQVCDTRRPGPCRSGPLPASLAESPRAQAAQANSDLEKADFPSYWMPKALICERVACATVRSGPAG